MTKIDLHFKRSLNLLHRILSSSAIITHQHDADEKILLVSPIEDRDPQRGANVRPVAASIYRYVILIVSVSISSVVVLRFISKASNVLSYSWTNGAWKAFRRLS